MAISNEQIAESLLAHYKEQNLDMTGLLSDPTFQSLGTADKVAFIQRNAKELRNGVHEKTPHTRQLYRTEIIKGVLGAAIPGTIAVASAWSRPSGANLKSLGLMLTGVGTVGGMIGATKAYIANGDYRAARNAIHQALNRTSEEPSLTNAVVTNSAILRRSNSEHSLSQAAVQHLEKIREKTMTPDYYVHTFQRMEGETK